jgi:hypothetical protein
LIGAVVVAEDKVCVISVGLYKLLIAREYVVFPLIDDFRALVASGFLVAVNAAIELGGVVYIDKNTEV